MSPDVQNWEPLSPAEVADVFGRAAFPWWIAGGHAIERAVGRQFRPHDDIDVLLLRRDSRLARDLLTDWECWAADPPGTLRPWMVGESLPERVSNVWCRAAGCGPWRFELMLDDSEGALWRSRRCSLVSKPIAGMSQTGAGDIPYLAVDIQLFYKAKAPRPKDEVDFAAALPLLTPAQKSWLSDALRAAYGPDNAWLRWIERLS